MPDNRTNMNGPLGDNESMAERIRRHFDLIEELDDLWQPNGAHASATHARFRENWDQARNGVLAKTEKIFITPASLPCPRRFRFKLHTVYKRKRNHLAPIELVSDPVKGTIHYHPDPFGAAPEEPLVLVQLDGGQAVFHPNISRQYGIVCLGTLPPGHPDLSLVVELLYGILNYSNMSLSDPADIGAARYFANDPDARTGLPSPQPLYGPEDPWSPGGGQA